MARFVILKGGANYKVFDFDGSIARVGAGDMMDLQIEAPDCDGDLFFLTKTQRGYEFEPRHDTLPFAVNGAPVARRQLLQDGDKVTFLDYIVIATYPPTLDAPKPAPAAVEAPPVIQPKASTETKPPVAAPPPEPPAQPKRPGAERPTVIIDSAAMAAQAQRQTPPPPPEPIPAPRPASRDTAPRPAAMAPAPPKEQQPPPQHQPQAPRKNRITPVYSLVGLSGQYKGQVKEIDTKDFLVGREGSLCDLVIDRTESGELDKSVSREHFVITSTDEGLYITDRKSRLRTFVNRKALEPNQREFIAPEDIITIPAPAGEIKFRLCFLGQENFGADKGKSKYTPIVIGLVLLIIALVAVIIWML